MGHDDAARNAAIRLIVRGVMTPAQAAKHAGVSRQLVHYWLSQAGVEWANTYDARLAKLWRKELSRRRGQ